MMSLETLILQGNPICNMNPDLTQIENDRKGLTAILDKYFGGAGGLGSAVGSMSLGGAGSSTLGKPKQGGNAFLGSGAESLSDPAAMRKKIAELEAENADLKSGSGKSQTMRAGGADWMQFNQGFERPTTASKRA